MSQTQVQLVGNVVTGGVFAGVVTATDFNSTSDINLKEDVKIIENPLDKILSIDGVSFKWKESKEQSIGVIAQELEKVFPELVKQSDNHKTVNYNGLIGVLIGAIKEQQVQIQNLQNLINTKKD